MTDAGKWIMIFGVLIALVGGGIWLAGRAGFRGLPGDISYQSDSGNVRFYFPIVTCIVISIVLTLGLWLWRHLSGR